MVRLGARLIELTAQTRNELFWKATWKVANRQSHSYPLSLRVGISAGSVAGIVLGVCRRFYCVYGPTVNRAARMCHQSPPNKIAASQTFADTQEIRAMPDISTTKCVRVTIKGLGEQDIAFLSPQTGGVHGDGEVAPAALAVDARVD